MQIRFEAGLGQVLHPSCTPPAPPLHPSCRSHAGVHGGGALTRVTRLHSRTHARTRARAHLHTLAHTHHNQLWCTHTTINCGMCAREGASLGIWTHSRASALLTRNYPRPTPRRRPPAARSARIPPSLLAPASKSPLAPRPRALLTAGTSAPSFLSRPLPVLPHPPRQRYQQSVDKAFDQSLVESRGHMFYHHGSKHFPVVIMLQTCEDNPNRVQSQSTFATFKSNGDATLAISVVKQKIQVQGNAYELQEIYGIEQGQNDAENSKECVICMSSPKDTTVLPCRHMCMCRCTACLIAGCALASCTHQTAATPCSRQYAFTLILR